MTGSVGERDLKFRILSDWNHKDSKRLLALIQELRLGLMFTGSCYCDGKQNLLWFMGQKKGLEVHVIFLLNRDQYMACQKKRVGEVDDDRLKFEISTICSREYSSHRNSVIELELKCKLLQVLESEARRGHICCASHGYEHKQNGAWVPLETSTKDILTGNISHWKKYACSPSPPYLKLMSTTELRAMFSIEDIKLPSWLDGMCMAEFLPHLEESLQKQVVEAVSLIDIRRRFIESLALFFGRPLEADPVFCRNATFLASSGSFVFLVHFLISTQFPKQQPALMLQSSQVILFVFPNVNHSGILKKSPLVSEYPWSPRWEASQMAERILDFLADESLNF
ncbi:hypothetical protein V6N13_082892 [Hibiscus sabdariffa]